jgi:hypothetical protein
MQGEEGIGGSGGGGMLGGDFGGDFGGDLDGLGEPGTEDMGDIGGDEGSADLDSMPLNEDIAKLINEFSKGKFFTMYSNMLKKNSNNFPVRAEILNENLVINEGLTTTLESLGKKINKKTELDELLD